LCFYIVLLKFISEAFAGGLYIRKDDLKFNGYPAGAAFQVNQNIVMSFTADDYYFSGGLRRFGYFVFLITRGSPPEGSVGEGGQNEKD
jgi:hypothetical protein